MIPLEKIPEFLNTFGSLVKVKLGDGVVTNITKIVIVAVMAFVLFAYAPNNTWMQFTALIMVFVLVIGAIITIIVFAIKHPDQAMMGGADFMAIRHNQMASKNLSEPPSNQSSIENPRHKKALTLVSKGE